jgi:hypothetical protein
MLTPYVWVHQWTANDRFDSVIQLQRLRHENYQLILNELVHMSTVGYEIIKVAHLRSAR